MADIKTILAENEKISHETLRANADQIDQARRFPSENLQVLGRAGVLGLLIPTHYGGAGAGIAEMSEVLDTQAQNCASTAIGFFRRRMRYLVELFRERDRAAGFRYDLSTCSPSCRS